MVDMERKTRKSTQSNQHTKFEDAEPSILWRQNLVSSLY